MTMHDEWARLAYAEAQARIRHIETERRSVFVAFGAATAGGLVLAQDVSDQTRGFLALALAVASIFGLAAAASSASLIGEYQRRLTTIAPSIGALVTRAGSDGAETQAWLLPFRGERRNRLLYVGLYVVVLLVSVWLATYFFQREPSDSIQAAEDAAALAGRLWI